MNITHFVHGMTSDGSSSVNVLARACQDADDKNYYSPLGYDWVSKREAYIGLKKGMYDNTPSDLAKELGEYIASKTSNGDNIVCHSLGAVATWSAMWTGRRYNKVVVFAGALDDDRLWPHNGMQQMWNIYCPDDRILNVADSISLSDFGGLGRFGYNGAPDSRIENVMAHPMTNNPDDNLHSFYFMEPDISHWCDFTVGILNG